MDVRARATRYAGKQEVGVYPRRCERIAVFVTRPSRVGVNEEDRATEVPTTNWTANAGGICAAPAKGTAHEDERAFAEEKDLHHAHVKDAAGVPIFHAT
jgi:hypothetical protein